MLIKLFVETLSIVIIAIMSVLCGVLFFTKNVLKSATTKGIKEMQDVYTEMIADLKQENKSLKRANAALKGWANEEEREEEEKQENLNPLVIAAAKKYGIPEEMLSDPQIKKMIKKYEHLLPMIAKFMPTSNNQMAQTFDTSPAANRL